MKIKNYKDLKVWQKARKLCVSCYKTTLEFPKSEQFGITNQIRRCSVSVASNIAEGHERATTKEFLQFIHIALGSLAELETQIIISSDLGFSEQNHNIFDDIEELSKMLNGLKKSLNQKINNINPLPSNPKPLISKAI